MTRLDDNKKSKAQIIKKHNTCHNTTHITQVHGSMKAKDVLNLVKDIKDKKDEKSKAKANSLQKKEQEKIVFIQCKKKCKALGLKECPVCHNILQSACSKTACRTDGKKPTMILPAAAATQKMLPKHSF